MASLYPPPPPNGFVNILFAFLSHLQIISIQTVHFPQIHRMGQRNTTAPPERARALTGKRRHGDGIALTKRQLIAVRRLSGEELALSVIASQCHSPGCGSQRLLRCRLHPAGRCPNSSSLFPPLAAVVAVAPKGRGFRTPLSFPHPLRLSRFFHAKKGRCISATAFSLRIRRGDDSHIS